MKVEDATQTVGGHPVRIYATDGKEQFPVHGAICIQCEWVIARWTREGKYYLLSDTHLDLNLHDWRDEIPWECLRDEIQWVARAEDGLWIGLSAEPIGQGSKSWVTSCDLHTCFSLCTIKMPSGPADWRESLAKRPEDL